MKWVLCFFVKIFLIKLLGIASFVGWMTYIIIFWKFVFFSSSYDGLAKYCIIWKCFCFFFHSDWQLMAFISYSYDRSAFKLLKIFWIFNLFSLVIGDWQYDYSLIYLLFLSYDMQFNSYLILCDEFMNMISFWSKFIISCSAKWMTWKWGRKGIGFRQSRKL